MWDQKGRPAGWNLRQELTLLSWDRTFSSSRKPQVLLLAPSTDWMRWPQCWEWPPLLKFWWWIWATSTKYLHNNIWTSIYLNHWRLAQPSWQPELTITVSVKLFCFAKSQHLFCYYWLLQSTWICIEVHYIWGAKSSREKGISFKDINLQDALPWPVVIWGVGLVEPEEPSLFSGAFPSPILVSGVWGLGNIRVWVTVVSCFRLPTSCRIGGLHSGEWFLLWSKVLWNLHRAPFPTEPGGEMGLVQPPLLTLT